MISNQELAIASFGESCCPPSFCVPILPFCNSDKRATVKIMLFTERLNTAYVVLFPVRVSNNEGHHFVSLGLSQFFACLGAVRFSTSLLTHLFLGFGSMFLTCVDFAEVKLLLIRELSSLSRNACLLNRFRRAFPPKIAFVATASSTHSSTMLREKFPSQVDGIASLPFTHFSACFRGMFPATIGARLSLLCLTDFFSCFWGTSDSKYRTSNFCNVETFLDSLRFVNPELLSFKQKRGKNKLNHFKDESLFAILVPSSLQMGVAMIVAPKHFTMFSPSLEKFDRTANVELLVNSTCNAVNARSFWKGLSKVIQWGHGESSPNRCSSLEVMGVATACGLDSLDLYYTPSTPFLSSFMAFSLCLLHSNFLVQNQQTP